MTESSRWVSSNMLGVHGPVSYMYVVHVSCGDHVRHSCMASSGSQDKEMTDGNNDVVMSEFPSGSSATSKDKMPAQVVTSRHHFQRALYSN